MIEKPFPSVSHLTQQLASFDADLIDLLERELLRDCAPYLGKKSFFKAALDQLNLFARKNLVAESFVHDARAFLAVASILLGDFPALREDQTKEVLAEAQTFRPKNPTVSKQIKASTLYLRSRFSSLSYGSQLVLCYVIHKDEKLTQSYARLFSWYEKIHGRADSLLSLVPLLPASLSVASVVTVPRRGVVFFPLPKTYQLLPLAKDYGENCLKNVELGKISFRPDDRSGWFDYQKYAYQALITSASGTHSAVHSMVRGAGVHGGVQGMAHRSARDDDPEKEVEARLSTVFRQFMAGTPIDLYEDDHYQITVFYDRLARAYAFLYDMITEIFAQEHRSFRREGKTAHLIS